MKQPTNTITSPKLVDRWLGQVHLARLRQTQELLAIKVQLAVQRKRGEVELKTLLLHCDCPFLVTLHSHFSTHVGRRRHDGLLVNPLALTMAGSAYLSLSFPLSDGLSLFVSVSVRPSVRLSVCLSVCLCGCYTKHLTAITLPTLTP